MFNSESFPLSKKNLTLLVRRNWYVRFMVFPILRPERFKNEFVFALIDYVRFRNTVQTFKKFIDQFKPVSTKKDRPGLMIVAGNTMNTQWCQMWSVMAAAYRKYKYSITVLTTKTEPLRNLYFRLFNFEMVFIEDLPIETTPLPDSLIKDIEALTEFMEFKEFLYDGAPVGKMALSTYSRQRTTGVIDVALPETREEVKFWLRFICKTMLVSKELYRERKTEILFFTEVFMEEYGALYYAALAMDKNVVRFAGTVRDDAVVVQHLNKVSDRTHHAAVTEQTWNKILSYPDNGKIDQELHQNFLDRYGDKWALSSRNQPNTKMVSPDVMKAELGLEKDKKIGIIYSHILYDTLFFIGKDLFPSYADWFVESVKAACENPNIEWFVKVHPSNLWRGELEQFFGGKYEEIRLIERYIGELPKHVHIIYPDTPYSPYSWFQVSDYGITVRGTSGIELGALGKTVITAGSGRYEKIGFTVNPKSADEYLNLLKSLPYGEEPTKEQKRLGVKFAYTTFCMKPYTLDFLTPVTRAGKTKIWSSDDLVYTGNFKQDNDLPDSLERFINWSIDKDSVDFLNEWPAVEGMK